MKCKPLNSITVFDSHFHIIDYRFRMSENKGFYPPEFTLDNYLQKTKKMGLDVIGGAVVAGSFHGEDVEHIKDTLNRLGKNFVGVINLPSKISREKVIELDKIGVRALRFNLFRMGGWNASDIERIAKFVYEVAGWHVEFYISSKEIPYLCSLLLKLPKLSIDHMGLSIEGLKELLLLVEKGVMVKATGFGRLDAPPQVFIKEILKVNPYSLMFGTDMPSTRAAKPFERQDLELLLDVAGEYAPFVLFKNAFRFYLNKVHPLQDLE